MSSNKTPPRAPLDPSVSLGSWSLSASFLVVDPAGKWGYGKLKDRKLAKADDIAADMDDPEADAIPTPQSSD